MKNVLKKNQAKLVAFLLCLLMAVVCMGPVLFSFFTSIKSELEIMSGGFSFLPSQPTLENYSELFSSQYSASYPIMKWFTNSLIVAVAQTVLVVLIASSSAYAYSRLKFRGKNIIFWFLMATMTFPSVINIIPLYKICQTMGIVNSLWALILPNVAGVFNIFLIRQFMESIPKELDEAAMIDGANRFQIYVRIILPLPLALHRHERRGYADHHPRYAADQGEFQHHARPRHCRRLHLGHPHLHRVSVRAEALHEGDAAAGRRQGLNQIFLTYGANSYDHQQHTKTRISQAGLLPGLFPEPERPLVLRL